jgi:hypothetical protein
VAVLFAFVSVALFWPSANTGAPVNSAAGVAPVVYRTLSIVCDPATGAFVYETPPLAVPAGASVIFTIVNHDPCVTIRSRGVSPAADRKP